jgi:peptidoglycan/LPS O-acetylase OafA/YrhL
LNPLGRVTPFVLFGTVAFAVLYSSVLWRIVYGGDSFGGVFNWKWLRAFGKYSYAIYVFHLPLFFAVTSTWFRTHVADYTNLTSAPGLRGWIGGSIVVLLLMLASFTIALFSWWALESRALSLRDRLSSKSAVKLDSPPIQTPLEPADAPPAPSS